MTYTNNAPDNAIDVWLAILPCETHESIPENERPECDDCDSADYEANTFLTALGYEIQWYHNAVGQVVRVEFETLSDAYDWYEANGYQDFTVED